MTTQITYRRGTMLTFVATRSFVLGATGQTVVKGQDLQFDGSTIEMGGDSFLMPQLKGAITKGWLVLEENFDAEDNSAEIPQTANIQVRHPTKGGNPMLPTPVARTSMATAEEEEREVGQVRSHADQTRAQNTGYRRGNAVNPVELQDGVPVRTLKTLAGEKAKHTRTVLTAGTVGSAIAAAGNVTIDPGQGITEAEMLDRMEEEEREEYLARKQALRAQYVEESPVVGRVKKAKATETREGITATVSAGGGVGIADLSGSDGIPEEQIIEQDGIKFTTTNGPKRADQPSPRAEQPVMLRDGTAEVRRQIAQQLCPDFPTNYDFSAPPKKKLARLQADYEDRPDVLRAVFAAETDAFKALLTQEFGAQLRA